MLPEERRSQLDGIIQQMVSNKEAESDIQFVVNDFKSKYDVAAKQSEKPGLTSDLKNVGREFVEGISNPKPSYLRNVDPVVLGPALNVAGQTGKALGGAVMAGGKAAVNALPDAITAPFKDMGNTVLKSLRGNPVIDAAASAWGSLPEESKTDIKNLFDASMLVPGAQGARAIAPVAKEGVNIGRDLASLAGQTAKVGAAKIIPKNAPQSLIDSGAKWGTTLSPEARKNLSRVMIDERLNLSPKGYEKLNSTIDGINNEIKTSLEPYKDTAIDARSVVKRTDEARNKAARSYDPASEVAKVDEESAKFLENWGEKLTVADAQSIKQDIYKQLKSHYDSVAKGGPGKYSDGEIAAKKNIARGLKEEIENAIPDAPIKELNARETRLLKLEPHLRRAVNRIENHNILSLDDVLSAGVGTTVGGLTGGPAGAVIGGAAAGVAKRALGHPGTKSRLAMALDSMQNAEIGIEPKSALINKLAGLDGMKGLLSRDIPQAMGPAPIPSFLQPGLAVGPVRSGVLQGESYAPPQSPLGPKMLPAGQGFKLQDSELLRPVNKFYNDNIPVNDAIDAEFSIINKAGLPDLSEKRLMLPAGQVVSDSDILRLKLNDLINAKSGGKIGAEVRNAPGTAKTKAAKIYSGRIGENYSEIEAGVIETLEREGIVTPANKDQALKAISDILPELTGISKPIKSKKYGNQNKGVIDSLSEKLKDERGSFSMEKKNIPAKTTPQAEAGYIKVYHATRENFDRFNLESAEPVSEQGFGAHWFFENKRFADDYLEAQSTAPEGRGNNPRVIEAYIDKKAKIFDVKKQKDGRVYRQIQRELDREYEDVGYLPDIDPYSDRHPIGYPYVGDSAPELIEKLKERGYDGAFFDEGNGRKSTAVWNEDLIKTGPPNPSRPPEVGGETIERSLKRKLEQIKERGK